MPLHKNKLLKLIIISQLLISACNADNSSLTPTPVASGIQTLIAHEVISMSTQIAATMQMVVTPPGTGISPKADLSDVTLSPNSPTSIPIAVYTALPGNCDKATFILDVTIPDSTSIPQATTFTKTWRLMNSGTCSWGKGYKLVLVGGDLMNAVSPAPLNLVAEPGATVDVSVQMIAPSTPKTYTGFWMLQNPTGGRFGIGSNGTNSFSVNISSANDTKVNTPITSASPTPNGVTNTSMPIAGPSIIPTATLAYFAVTYGHVSVNPSDYSGPCPAKLQTRGFISVNWPGTVTYYTVLNGVSHTPLRSFTFTESGTIQTAWEDLTISADGYGYVELFINSPNPHTAARETFSVKCIDGSSSPTPLTVQTIAPAVLLIPPTPIPTRTPTPITPTVIPTATPIPTPTPTPTP